MVITLQFGKERNNKLMQFYIKYDENGYLTDTPSTTNADGLTPVYVQDNWVLSILNYPDKFRYNGSSIEAPGNLPKQDTNELLNKLTADSTEHNADIQSLTQQLLTLTGLLGGM